MFKCKDCEYYRPNYCIKRKLTSVNPDNYACYFAKITAECDICGRKIEKVFSSHIYEYTFKSRIKRLGFDGIYWVATDKYYCLNCIPKEYTAEIRRDTLLFSRFDKNEEE